jgi:peroxiredoxin
MIAPMTDQSTKPLDRFTVFLVVACAALAVLTLLLAWQNRDLKAQLATALGAPPVGGLKAGDTLVPFDVVSATGETTHVTFEGQRQTLLLVFSSTCGACRETIPVWNRLFADGVSSKVQVVGIQIDLQHDASTGSTLAIPDLRFPVFSAANPAGAPMSKFPAIPAAALVDAKGAVKSVWFGVPTDAQVSELRSAIAS